MSTSVFGFKDFIRFILPTAIGASLIAPILIPESSTISLEGLVFVVVLLCYVIYTPISMLCDFVQSHIPFSELRFDEAKEQEKILSKRWDDEAIWHALDKDEKEYLELGQSYIGFYQTTGVYLLIYAIGNLIYFGWAFVNSWSIASTNWISFFLLVSAIKTRTIVQFDIPTWLVITLSVVCSYYLLHNAVVVHKIFQGSEGVYEKYAQRYQVQKGNLATAIWGKVHYKEGENEHPLIAVRVVLKRGGKVIQEAISNNAGDFQFLDAYQKNISYVCVVEVADAKWRGRKSLRIESKVIPYYELTATPR